MTDLDRLEALAKEATPGPWMHEMGNCGYRLLYWARSRYGKHACNDWEPLSWGDSINNLPSFDEATAKYISECSPDVILKLIAENRRYREALRICSTKAVFIMSSQFPPPPIMAKTIENVCNEALGDYVTIE